MADIELVVKVPEEDYLIFSELSEKEKINELSYYERMIANGTPLPKGHGRLIDADEVNDAIYKCFEDIQCYDGTGYDIYSDSKESIDKIPTIIEADNEVKK